MKCEKNSEAKHSWHILCQFSTRHADTGGFRTKPPTNEIAASGQGDKFRGYPIVQGLHSPSGGPDSCPPDNVRTSGAQHLATIETDTKAERWNAGRKAKVLPMTDESRPSWRRKIGIKYRRWHEQTAGGAAALTFPPLFRAYPPFPFLFHRQPWLTLLSTMRSSSTTTRRRWVDSCA